MSVDCDFHSSCVTAFPRNEDMQSVGLSAGQGFANVTNPNAAANSSALMASLQNGSPPGKLADTILSANMVPDYNALPIGWRPTTYMGKCGWAIQERDFYTQQGSSCYPIQDISCMTPLQKRVWSDVCHANFPLKPMPIKHSIPFVKSIVDPVGWLRGTVRILYNGLPLIASVLGMGVGIGYCLSAKGKDGESSECESDEDEDDHDEDEADSTEVSSASNSIHVQTSPINEVLR